MNSKIRITKRIAKELRKLKEEESCFIYGKENFNKIYHCSTKRCGEDKYEVEFFSLLLFSMIILFGNYSCVCFCHCHSNFKDLSLTDYGNMFQDFLYMIVYNFDFFVYKKVNNKIQDLEVEIIDERR